MNNRYAERRELGEIDKFGIEKRYLHKNGQPVWVTLYVSALRDDGGHVNRVVTITQLTLPSANARRMNCGG